jgi:hypothetical protein
LPNRSKLPTASSSAESSEEIFLRQTRFFTKLGPQIRLSLVQNFGVNTPPADRKRWSFAKSSRDSAKAAAAREIEGSVRRGAIWAKWLEVEDDMTLVSDMRGRVG